MKKVSVIGAGNGGMTAAYHLSKMGFEVCLYDHKNFDTQVNAVNQNGGIRALEEAHDCEMILGGFEANIHGTTDPQVAAAFADELVMICPSFAQEILFRDLLPYLHNDQMLLLMPGNYGGLVLEKIKQEERPELKLSFADAISIPWACRIHEPGVITIMGIKSFLPVSLFPKTQATEKNKMRLQAILPIPLELLRDPLTAGLENINFGGHPLLTTLNMGILENFQGDFNYYKDCCSIATANAAAKMDKERLAVGNAYNIQLRTELEAMNALYASEYLTVYEFNRASSTHGKINSAPASSKSRYVSEDVPYLLVPCYELAKLAGIEVPIVESCIHIASAYNDENYFETGRNLASMGLQGKTIQEIIQYLA